MRTLTAVLDTGSSVTLMLYDKYIATGYSSHDLVATQDNIQGLNQQPLNIIGKAWISIRIGYQRESIQVYLMKQLPYEMILGTDLMSRFPWVMFDWKNKLFRFPRQLIPMNGISYLTPEQRGRVQLIQETLYQLEL